MENPLFVVANLIINVDVHASDKFLSLLNVEWTSFLRVVLDICIQKTQKCIHSMILLFISQSAHKDLPTRQNFVMNAVLAWLQF